MSRFTEGDGFDSDEQEEQFFADLHKGYVAARPVLVEFLAYLDNMPVKRIIRDRFVKPATGEMCAVAAFCQSRGFEWKKLLDIERDSRLQRMSNEGPEDDGGLNGPTVWAGESAGLSPEVALDLAWKNDMVWTHVRGQPITPEERWKKLRALVASKIESTACEAGT